MHGSQQIVRASARSAPKSSAPNVRSHFQRHGSSQELWKAERTALFNRVRGLLAEFGIVVEVGASKIRRKLAELESDEAYPQSIQLKAQSVRAQVEVLDQRLAEYELWPV